jgi:hypothetical protein
MALSGGGFFIHAAFPGPPARTVSDDAALRDDRQDDGVLPPLVDFDPAD